MLLPTFLLKKLDRTPLDLTSFTSSLGLDPALDIVKF